MRGKTSKLLRRAVLTNPYRIKENMWKSKTKYTLNLSQTQIIVAPGKKFTYKQLKKLYKNKIITTYDIKKLILEANGQ
jgi:hypothetical protein